MKRYLLCDITNIVDKFSNGKYWPIHTECVPASYSDIEKALDHAHNNRDLEVGHVGDNNSPNRYSVDEIVVYEYDGEKPYGEADLRYIGSRGIDFEKVLADYENESSDISFEEYATKLIALADLLEKGLGAPQGSFSFMHGGEAH